MTHTGGPPCVDRRTSSTICVCAHKGEAAAPAVREPPERATPTMPSYATSAILAPPQATAAWANS
eukprot:CAMPEP_0177557438 /NCGR_PEP_ID=MMETSP0369-20130122/69687_1 /TAXON_ID=447022 ORGANISM="Scrippsiella hangoei-like, Strain SHHI-4" /NCGR_SAMPLE_ID=MMETSP0369 /ASSEMBLY_ACC=CAM_ASM_000364 /LENGTH=64 /DNA_ID=CAMNT_0019043869 /DNA_START=24 /DNA_END=214 /DNA_ORIENTATION=+